MSNRAMVVVVASLVGVLALSGWVSIAGLGSVIVAVLLGLDVVLINRTSGLAFARTKDLDERQVASRNRAYRIGFRLVGLALVLIVVASTVGVFLLFVTPHAVVDQQDTMGDGVRPGVLLAILEVLFIMPTLVLAWDWPPEEERRSLAAIRVAGTAVLAALLAVILDGVLVAVAPVAASTTIRNPDINLSVTGARCAHFLATRVVGFGVSGALRMRAEVCWDGQKAFVLGHRSTVPLPQGVPYGDEFAVADAVCGFDEDQQDLIRVADNGCALNYENDGSAHYRVAAHVYPGVVPVGGREIVVELAVARDGHVIRFG